MGAPPESGQGPRLPRGGVTAQDSLSPDCGSGHAALQVRCSFLSPRNVPSDPTACEATLHPRALVFGEDVAP